MQQTGRNFVTSLLPCCSFLVLIALLHNTRTSRHVVWDKTLLHWEKSALVQWWAVLVSLCGDLVMVLYPAIIVKLKTNCRLVNFQKLVIFRVIDPYLSVNIISNVFRLILSNSALSQRLHLNLKTYFRITILRYSNVFKLLRYATDKSSNTLEIYQITQN